MNIQGWFPLGLTGLISLLSEGLSRTSPVPQIKSINSSALSLLYGSIHNCTWLQEKPQLWLYGPLLAKWCLCFLICCLGAFLPRSKHVLISWLQSPSAVILEPKKIKSVTLSIFFPVYLPWNNGTGCHDLSFLNVEFHASFSWGLRMFLGFEFSAPPLPPTHLPSPTNPRIHPTHSSTHLPIHSSTHASPSTSYSFFIQLWLLILCMKLTGLQGPQTFD